MSTMKSHSLCPRCTKRRSEHLRRRLVPGGEPTFVTCCEVTDTMLEALRKFKRYEGKTWKHKLRMAWLRGDELGSELRAIRNIVGPSRLDKVHL